MLCKGLLMYFFILKNFFILITCFYVYTKLMNIKTSFSKILICSTILSVTTSVLTINSRLFCVVFSYTLFYFAALIAFYSTPKLCFTVSMIAYAFSNGCFILSSIFWGVVFFLLSKLNYSPTDVISSICCGILSFSIAHIPFQFRKYQKGIKNICSENFSNIVFFVGLLIILILTVGYQISRPSKIDLFMPYYILLAAALLFLLWKQQIKRYYLAKLRKLELESLRQELEEKDAKIRALMKSNEDLARTIHKDNKLIPAMLSAITDYLESSGSDDSGGTGQAEALIRQLKTLGSDRMTLLEKSTRIDSTVPQTGHAAVDAMLSYMGKRAEAEKITYQVKLHPEFSARIGTEISESDLTHLLSDLIENALIATKSTDTRSLLVHLGILSDAPAVEISDTGLPFAPEVYDDLGLSRHSTHLDSGGSGIGLMDIWKFKKKYAASLHIYEYPTDSKGFTKKICLVFDHRKHYLIQSCRAEELLQVHTRGDLYILPLDKATS